MWKRSSVYCFRKTTSSSKVIKFPSSFPHSWL